MNKVLVNEVTEQLEGLPDDEQYHVLTFIISLKNQQLRGVSGERLLKYAGIFSTNDAEAMMQTIEHDCRKTHDDLWT